jgi:hypothetical protein
LASECWRWKGRDGGAEEGTVVVEDEQRDIILKAGCEEVDTWRMPLSSYDSSSLFNAIAVVVYCLAVNRRLFTRHDQRNEASVDSDAHIANDKTGRMRARSRHPSAKLHVKCVL